MRGAGNYLSLKNDIWGTISALFNELWFVSVDREVARKRLIARHLATGLVDTPEAAAKRADENDLPNGDFIIANMMVVHRMVRSIPDEHYARNC